MKDIKRYAEYDRGIHESDFGDYMKVEDHEEIVSKLEAEIADLQEQVAWHEAEHYNRQLGGE